jgi:hypothetical protein
MVSIRLLLDEILGIVHTVFSRATPKPPQFHHAAVSSSSDLSAFVHVIDLAFRQAPPSLDKRVLGIVVLGAN